MLVRSTAALLVATVIVPLALLLLGVWELSRGVDHLNDLVAQRAELSATIANMEAMPAPALGGINTAIRFTSDGQTYVGDLALSKAHEALTEFGLPLAVARYRQVLPPGLIASSAAVLAIGLLTMGGATLLGALGSRSRNALIGGFSVVRRVLPVLLTGHLVLLALAVLLAVAFESAVLIRTGAFSRSQVYFSGIALLMIGAALVTAVQAVMQLRRVSKLFEPDQFELIAMPVSRRDAPGLWRLVDAFSQRLNMAAPDTIVVGWTRGFFVMSGEVRLLPADRTVRGNTLHVPLGHLAMMRTDEAATIIGHELAHFAGEDTVYSEKFLPIYAGVDRSLDAIAASGRARDGSLSLLAQPALRLGVFVMDRFHLAVRHWSRRREFEADAVSATLTSPGAAGRALLRHEAIAGLVNDIVQFAWANPDQVPDDLVAFMLQQAPDRGLDDPSQQLAGSIPHPTDTHPSNADRLAAFSFSPTPEHLADAMELPQPDAAGRLGHYFAMPDALAREATAGLLAASRRSSASHRELLTTMAAQVGDDVVELYENSVPIALIMFIVGVPLLAAAAWAAIAGLPGLGSQSIFLAMILAGIGLFIVGLGFYSLNSARTPFLRLYPDRIEHRHLDRPIFWSDVRDMAVSNNAGTMITAFLLKRQAVFPKRRGGGRRARVSPDTWTVTLSSVPPKHYKSAGYIELMHRYADAAAARNALGEVATV